MKAAGISGDIRLISTLDSVAVGKSRTAVVAFIGATVANTSRSGDALERPVASAGASQSRTATTNLACASQIVSTWTTTQLANETIAIPRRGHEYRRAWRRRRGRLRRNTSLRHDGPGVDAPSPRHSAARRPGQYAWMVMTDEEGGGVERLTNLVGSFPWAQTMGKNLNATQITAIARARRHCVIGRGINTDLAPVLDVDGRAQFPARRIRWLPLFQWRSLDRGT